MRTGYKPRRVSGDSRPLSDKSVHNVWVALSAFFSWAKMEFNLPDPMDGVPAPRFEEAPFEPLSRDAVEILLKVRLRQPPQAGLNLRQW